MAVAGIVLAAVGAIAGVAGYAVQAKAASDENAASQRAEDLRQQQLNLESQRQNRQIIRDSIAARSQALSAATNQGASGPGSSGLAGGEAGVSAKAGFNIGGVSLSNQIGNGIFAANKDLSNAQTLASFGQGLTGFGQIISGIQVPS